MKNATLWLVRHGETEWSRILKHTGRTDVALTPAGETQARNAAPHLRHLQPGLVLCSPLQRARQTATLAGFTDFIIDEDLAEWDYGSFEGERTHDIRIRIGQPDWVIWNSHIPAGDTPGEQVEDVGRRADRVLSRCRASMASGQDCLLFAHGHFLRILTARWLGLPAQQGRLFRLDPVRLSGLGIEHEQPVIQLWNSPAEAAIHHQA